MIWLIVTNTNESNHSCMVDYESVLKPTSHAPFFHLAELKMKTHLINNSLHVLKAPRVVVLVVPAF